MTQETIVQEKEINEEIRRSGTAVSSILLIISVPTVYSRDDSASDWRESVLSEEIISFQANRSLHWSAVRDINGDATTLSVRVRSMGNQLSTLS